MQPEAPPESVQHDPGVSVHTVAPGAERFTARGSHFVIETSVPDPTIRRKDWHRILPTVVGKNVNATDMLFLDTETTGLDRGTGTHVFLVGLGYFSGDAFHVQQHFSRDLHEEPSLLWDIEQLMREFSVLVTFNGRGFDWPMLSTRFILHGHRDVPELNHWDLLTSSRRVWRHRLRDCSLGSLERSILGVQRFGDVPGYLIPDLYFDYLRSRDARPLRPVFSHNQEDIVSLARLADRLLQTEQDPFSSLDHPVDQVSYGVYLLNQGDLDRAQALIRPNLHLATLDDDLRFRASSLLANSYKRNGQCGIAIEIWFEMLAHRWDSAERILHPLVELAKAHEHRLGDVRTARHFVERAMNLASLYDWRESHAALTHRHRRLLRRLNKQS